MTDEEAASLDVANAPPITPQQIEIIRAAMGPIRRARPADISATQTAAGGPSPTAAATAIQATTTRPDTHDDTAVQDPAA